MQHISKFKRSAQQQQIGLCGWRCASIFVGRLMVARACVYECAWFICIVFAKLHHLCSSIPAINNLIQVNLNAINGSQVFP